MKVWTRAEVEVEVDVSEEDAIAALGAFEEPQRTDQISWLVTRMHRVLKAIPDEMIEGLTPEHRKIIHDALRVQIDRWAPPA